MKEEQIQALTDDLLNDLLPRHTRALGAGAADRPGVPTLARVDAAGRSLNPSSVRAFLACAAAVLLVPIGCTRGGDPLERPAARRDRVAGASRADACDAPVHVLRRVRRGYFPGRSGDVVMVEAAPNQLGTIHSTPWGFTQRVPLVLYGPGHVRSGVRSRARVTLADLAPTYARLLRFDAFPRRDGRPLEDALLPDAAEPPRLIVTVVWDGGGTNVLRRWPRSWPHLRRLQQEGVSYGRATVGSSPSVTPAVHATLGTGSWPAGHGLPDVKVRLGDRVADPWEGGSPRLLEKRAFADLWDAAAGDVPKIGVLARDFWHVGMIGHGSMISGDKDVAVVDDLDTPTSFTTNPDFYTLPPYVHDTSALADAIAEVDGRDGLADGLWLGNPLDPADGAIRATPPWNILQTDKVLEILRREGFGSDAVPDLFFTNYKSTDLAGHAWNMEEPEVRDNLAQQDEELGRLVRALDALVGEGRYVLVLTADHGMAPYPEVRGGWPIDMPEVTRDVDRRFAPPGDEVVAANRGFQMILDEEVLHDAGHDASGVAAFLRGYTVRENAADDPALDGDEGDEKVFLTALTQEELRATARCRG